MNGFPEFLRFEAFSDQAELMIGQYPREIMLTEGIILVLLGLGFAVFLLTALIRRKAMAIVAASLAGMAFLLEALAFDRLDFLSPAGGQVLIGLFIAAAIMFLTATTRAARENMVLGAVLLGAIIAAVGLGVADYFGMYDGDTALRLFALGLAVFAVGLSIQQAVAGDRRAALIAPGTLVAAASLAAFVIAGQNGMTHWSGYAIPHGMFAGGILFAGFMSLMAPGARAQENDDIVVAPAGHRAAEPVVSLDAGETPPFTRKPPETSAKEGREEPEEADEDEALPDGITDLAAVGEIDDEPGEQPPAEPPLEHREEDDRPPASQSPISALWGHKHTAVKKAAAGAAATAATAAGPDAIRSLRAALGAEGRALWDWRADGQINASEETASLFGVGKTSRLTPETIREQIDPSDLETYDDEILGGADPQAGRFAFELMLAGGRRLSLKGERQVDEDGLIDRIIAFIAPARGAKTAAPGIGDEEIRQGLLDGEFEAWFQPVVRLADEEIAGFEALARWRRDGEKEALLPERFMDTAIDAGLEMDITAAVLDKAASELAAWIGSGPVEGQFVSFNVSAGTLLDDRLVQHVKAEIKRHKLPRGALVVELTESHVLHDEDKALSIAKSLRQAGARIALDDLGAGQSSLNRLSSFRFDFIKTDRSLLDAAMRDEHGRTLFAGLVDMAHKMGTEVVAEGIQSAEAADMLREFGCDYAQGYYYGLAEPASGEGGGAQDDDDAMRQSMMAELR